MDYEKQIDRITEFIKTGEKSAEDFKIGVEFEHIVVWKKDLLSVNYYEENGIEIILKKLLDKNQKYKPQYEGEHLVGLSEPDGSISLEPGGQFEYSVRPCSTLAEIENLYRNFLDDIIPILEEQGQYLMGIGYHPKTKIVDLPFNPKIRYHYMSEHLIATGKYAHNMMKGTASLQVVIDYSDEEDFIKKFTVGNFLSPLLYLISDNAPIFEGEIHEENSIRSKIWDNMDNIRCGIVPGVLEKKFGYDDYAKYILDVPPILIMRDGEAIGTGDKKVRELMDPLTITDKEVDHILSMVFPDVRIRTYIELRMGDSLPYPLNMAYIALLKGIFYNNIALDYLYDMARTFDQEELEYSKTNMRKNGFEGRFKFRTVKDLALILFDLAKRGLDEKEREYLKPLEELIIKGQSAANLSKEYIKEKGIESLSWYALNQYGR
ncbi:MAG: glutamate--cysteine ligase [Clostridiales bacterium]|nr:glutamate--cysteine ligase [Clostridiales bacterium]